MHKIFPAVITGLLLGLSAGAQINYTASGIPDSLSKGAGSVKRIEESFLDISDMDRAELSVHTICTVLDKRGDDELVFNDWTTKYRSLEDFEIKTYNALGVQTGRYKKKDLIKYSFDQGLIEDGSSYYLKVPATSYPITVETNYTFKYSGTTRYPRYSIITPGEGVQHSSFWVRVPTELGLRYQEQKVKLAPAIVNDGKYLTYKWEVNNLVPIKYEQGGPSSKFCYPAILLAPNAFKFYNTKGDLSSWRSFGQWEQGLLNGLDVLPEDRKVFFSDLTKNATSDREKVRQVYDYLQGNFRYVSIQLGIGGMKPFPAAFTDEKKYGDCKGLSFYVHAVLKSLGIKSYLALINSQYNNEPVNVNFPMNGFDHVILCVPLKQDSIWLECTSKNTEFGVLGSFTENRNALLITESGGVLVATPASKPSANGITVRSTIDLNEDGSGTTKTLFCSKGEEKMIMNELGTAKKDEQKDFIINYLGFKQPDEYTITSRAAGSECSTELGLTIEKIPEFTAGNKMFLSPRIYSFVQEKLPASEGRTQDYYFKNPFERNDSTVYNLPAGYIADALPAAASRKCAFATYSSSYVYNQEKRQLTSVAQLVLYVNRIPAKNYSEVKAFFDGVRSDEAHKIVIKKN